MSVPLEWLLAGLACIVGALDGLTTQIGLRDNRVEEINPLVRWLLARMPPSAFVPAFASVSTLLSLAAFYLLDRWDLGTAAQAGWLAAHAAAPINNLLVLYSLRKKHGHS